MEAIYAVIDTNVLVSGLISSRGAPARIVELLRSGELRAVVDDRITAEYLDVLKRQEFGFPAEEVEILLQHIISLAVYAEIGSMHMVAGMKDPGDAPFAECALSFGCPIVTGNAKHYRHVKLKTCRVLSPSAFMEYLSHAD